MCGLTGFLLPRKIDADEQAILKKMNDTLTHRGPDAEGLWSDREAGIMLGHRRLSIIDLTNAGAQPMESPSGRYIIAYNGEVYNFGELRSELEKEHYRFRGHSDTEVILSAIECWGLTRAVKRFVGMFAFSVWDRKDRCLHCVRDRLGIKPFFFSFLNGGGIAFGSELKALKEHPSFDSSIRRDVLPQYLRYNYIPDPWTIYSRSFKLQPGKILTMDAEAVRAWDGENLKDLKIESYWDAREVLLGAKDNPSATNDQEAVEGLETVLKRSVRDRLVSDVPLGAFLSGGVDSSVIVSLMREISSGKIRTFTIGFLEDQFNEAAHAAAVAERLETEHTELYVTPEEAMQAIPLLPMMYDEPYSDYSNIPTFLVSRLTRSSVTVSLSGDGGDELFGGYNRHILLPGLWCRLRLFPLPLRRIIGQLLISRSPDQWDHIAAKYSRLVSPFGISKKIPADTGYKLHKLSESLTAATPAELYLSLISEWKNPDHLLTEEVTSEHEQYTDGLNQHPILSDPIWKDMPELSEATMFLDLIHYLPDDILTKVDRASMAVSLESRVPILDHRVVEYAWGLPVELKIRDGQGKLPLRNLLYRYVPRELIERPKQGFTVPVGEWLRGPLREWAEDLIDNRNLCEEGIFKPDIVRELWEEHLSGRRNHDGKLWPVLMYQAWRAVS